MCKSGADHIFYPRDRPGVETLGLRFPSPLVEPHHVSNMMMALTTHLPRSLQC
jgi:hypothetical protein